LWWDGYSRPKCDTQLNHGGHIMLRKLRGLVVVLGVTVSLSATSGPTDAGAYTCGYRSENCGHGCYDGDYGGRRYFRHRCHGGGHYDRGCDDGRCRQGCYGGNPYGRRFDDCGRGRDYRGYGHDYDGYGDSDGGGGSSGDYCRSCVSPWCRRFYRCE